MNLSYKYRIYPNQQQIKILEGNFEFCRFLYNCALEERISSYKKLGISQSYEDQSKQLPEIRKSFMLESKHIYAQTLQQTLKRLDLAYSFFFRRIKASATKAGFPRFKSKDRFRSILFPQSDLTKGGVKLLNNQKLKVFGLGEIKVKWHRPWKGRCKQVSLVKSSDKYFVILYCDDVPKELLPKTNKEVAIDLGLNNFMTTDDGTKFRHPKPYKTAKEKLKFLNQKLALKKKGSNNRLKAKKALAKAYEKITNIRDNYLHNTSKQLVKNYDKIIIEDLNVKSMMEAKGFIVNKSNIQDASWARFASQLKYKAEKAGKLIIDVDPKNTSKTCSKCLHLKDDLTLQDRIYQCKACGFELDRDHNAALNIKRLGTSPASNHRSHQPCADGSSRGFGEVSSLGSP